MRKVKMKIIKNNVELHFVKTMILLLIFNLFLVQRRNIKSIIIIMIIKIIKIKIIIKNKKKNLRKNFLGLRIKNSHFLFLKRINKFSNLNFIKK